MIFVNIIFGWAVISLVLFLIYLAVHKFFNRSSDVSETKDADI